MTPSPSVFILWRLTPMKERVRFFFSIVTVQSMGIGSPIVSTGSGRAPPISVLGAVESGASVVLSDRIG